MYNIDNLHEDEIGELEGEVFLNNLKKTIIVSIEDGIEEEYIQQQLSWLNELKIELFNDLYKYSFTLLQETMKNYPDMEILNKYKTVSDYSDMKGLVSIESLRIECPEEENVMVLNLSGFLEWDEENQFQWLIKDNKTVFFGIWEDYSVWYSDLEDDILNYVLH